MEEDEASPLNIQGDYNPKIKPKLKNQLLATLAACLSSFTMGLTLGYSSPAIPDFRRNGVIVLQEGTWFGSLASLGAIFGGPVGGYLLNKTGRRSTIMYGSIPYVTGWLTIICGKSVVPLYIGRSLTGLGIGMTCVSVSVYIAEVSSKQYRGALGSISQICMVVGILVMYLLGSTLDAYWLAVINIAPCTIMVLLLFFMPETPRWLLQNGLYEAALASLTWLRGEGSDVNNEYNDIKMFIDSQENESSIKLNEFTQPKLYKPLIISFGLMLLQQLTGISAVGCYADDIFASAGFTGSIPSVIIAAVQVVFTTIAMILMDKVGRKKLLLLSTFLMAVSCAIFGGFYYVTEKHNITGLRWLAVVSLSVYIMGNAIGLCPIPWLIMSEVFPVRIKGFATSAATIINWSSGFIVSETFWYLVQGIGLYWTFWLYGLIAFSGIFFVIFVVVETKGKSLEEIELQFEGRSYANIIMYQSL